MTASRIPSIEGGIQPTLLTTKGDILVATAASTVSRLSSGTSGQVLISNSNTATGLEYTSTLTAPTLTGTVTASGDINLSVVGGPGSIKDQLTLILMGAI